MPKETRADGSELRAALGEGRRLLLAVAVFSFFVNLLMLTGPIFMLQVYDRVLTSRSEATLSALIVIAAFLFAMMGFLDYARGRVLARLGVRFQARLDGRVFDAILRRSVATGERARPATGLRDLGSIRTLLSGPAPFAAFDAPWTPVFIAAIFLFHWTLGVLALGGGALIVLLAALNQFASRPGQTAASEAEARAETLAEAARREGETLRGLGMNGAMLGRWRARRTEALAAGLGASDATAVFSTASRTLRFFLQSAMLGAGAYLAIRQIITPGAMIAASILLGRSLAPVEQAIAQWPVAQRALQGWRALSDMLAKTPPPPERTALPAPRPILEAEQLTVAPPMEQAATLRMVSFRVGPGEALGVIGPSASGKTTLARAIAGVWRPSAGRIRLDGAALEQYAEEALARHVGYLPQEVALFDGTVAENIARMAEAPDDGAVVLAAQRAGAHEMILGLPDGYDTQVGPGGARLSGGRRQRIGLARALFGDPAVVVLDEPNSSLDADGSEALNRAIGNLKARGKAVVIMAHRPAAIHHCDLILMLEDGARRAFGPKNEVLRRHVSNYPQLVGQTAPEASR